MLYKLLLNIVSITRDAFVPSLNPTLKSSLKIPTVTVDGPSLQFVFNAGLPFFTYTSYVWAYCSYQWWQLIIMINYARFLYSFQYSPCNSYNCSYYYYFFFKTNKKYSDSSHKLHSINNVAWSIDYTLNKKMQERVLS